MLGEDERRRRRKRDWLTRIEREAFEKEEIEVLFS